MIWKGNRCQTGKPSRYVTNHPGQLSLAIPSWVNAISRSKSWYVGKQAHRATH